MNSLGHKKNKIKTLGSKNYYLNYLGHKSYEKNNKDSNLQTTPTGIIENYANHPNTLYEPIKGVEIKQNKNNYQIEKSRPKRNKNNYD